ncbi:hypothetical protein BD770DRAFT_416199 [Pilaira anomala]|nr:hypothetical protein BD770DRAFT_416199 [Pilaira anomala]
MLLEQRNSVKLGVLVSQLISVPLVSVVGRKLSVHIFKVRILFSIMFYFILIPPVYSDTIANLVKRDPDFQAQIKNIINSSKTDIVAIIKKLDFFGPVTRFL